MARRGVGGSMKFRRQAVALLVATTAIVIVVMTFVFDRLVSGMTDRVEDQQYRLMEEIVLFNMKGAEDRAIARAEIIASIPSVRHAMIAHDREALLSETREMYRIQHARYGMDQAQFYER